MATETLTFDSDGDLVLILSRVPTDGTKSASLPWSEKGSMSASVQSETREQGEELSNEAQANVTFQPESNGVDDADDVDNLSAKSRDIALYDSLMEDTFSKEKEPEILVHMLVSSKHMILASPVFKAMLQTSTFKEGQKLNADGKAEVPLPEDDPTAFEVVLNAIHGRNKLVPRALSLELLNSVCLLVDKYQMAEAVEPFSDTWFNALMVDLPQVYVSRTNSDNVHLWLQASWVFEKDEVFTKMTRLLERGCNEYFHLIDERLLIPNLIVESILAKRREALGELYDFIEETIKRYQQPEILCPRTDNKIFQQRCDSLILGSLLKSATKLGIIPAPKSPYGNISFDEMSARLYNLDVNAICDSFSRPVIRGAYPKPAHGLKDLIEGKIVSLKERLSGLNIQDFKGKGKSSRSVVGA